jgi:nitrite reductase/ring-hydroxylating ferredoxin subunit
VTESTRDITVAPLSAIAPGEGRTFEIAGERIAIFHTRAGNLFAVQAACPHRGGPLADGLIGEDTLICPLHAAKFNLATGTALAGPTDSCLKTYPVRLNDRQQIVLTRW